MNMKDLEIRNNIKYLNRLIDEKYDEIRTIEKNITNIQDQLHKQYLRLAK